MPRKLDTDSQIGRRLSLRDLHLFLTVAKQGSMAKAAAQLGISQPSVSEVIADLERALDARLFDRRPRGVEPTLYGQALLKRTRAVFDELRQGVRDIEFLDDPSFGEVRIGFPAAAMATFLPPLIQKFSEAYPKVVLRLSEVPTSAIYSVLRERLHDLHLEWCVPPFTRDDVESDVNVEYLFDDHFVIVAGLRSQWARRRKIDLAELQAEPWILNFRRGSKFSNADPHPRVGHSRVYFAVKFVDYFEWRARRGTDARRSACFKAGHEISHRWGCWKDFRTRCSRNRKSAQPTSLDVLDRGGQVVKGALYLPTNEVAQHRSGPPIRHVDGFHPSRHFEEFASDVGEGACPKRRHRHSAVVCLQVIDEFRNVSGRNRGMNF
jgi:DNA-binding transcriptional LysR family regulator